jgi:predicted NAD/FAD-binding protein
MCRFDAVVLATHSDVSLSLLGAGATEEERAVLAAIPYNNNDIYLHTDEALMPVSGRLLIC